MQASSQCGFFELLFCWEFNFVPFLQTVLQCHHKENLSQFLSFPYIFLTSLIHALIYKVCGYLRICPPSF